MFPKSISENLMYSTVRITTNTNTGTGFFYKFNIKGHDIPVIITNKHVVNYERKKTVTLLLHTGDYTKKCIDPNSITINYEADWIHHPSQDLCFCFFNPLFEHVRATLNKNIFFCTLEDNLILDSKNLEDLNAIENVIMIGYPNGLWNKNDNLPLFRKGITSSHPGVNFKADNSDMQNDNIGVVDMACFPGSSGSPIFILDENGYADKNGTIFLDGRRVIFLGILFAGPTMALDGEIVVQGQQNISTKSSIMINLGYYIKSYELDVFKEIIENNFEI